MESTNADTAGECSHASPETKSINSCINNLTSTSNRKIYFCKTCGKCIIKFWKGRSQVKRIDRKSSPAIPKFTTMTKPRKRRGHNNHTCLSCKKVQGLKYEHDTNHPPLNKQKLNQREKAIHKSLF